MRTMVCALLCFGGALIGNFVGAPASRNEVVKWASYRNQRFDYCILYPARWHHDEPVTKNGLTLAPPVDDQYVFEPTISVGGRVNQRMEENGPSQTLEDIFDSGIRGLREHEKAEDITVLKKEKLAIEGFDALATTIQYKEGGKEWFDKDVELIDNKQIVYFTELKCHPNDSAALLPIFDRIVKSLRLACAKNTRRTGN